MHKPFVCSAWLFVCAAWPGLLAGVIGTAGVANAVAEAPNRMVVILPISPQPLPTEAVAEPLSATAANSAARVQPAANIDIFAGLAAQQAHYQVPAQTGRAPEQLRLDLMKDPCAGMNERPLGELGIDIGESGGEMPDDWATQCWMQINAEAGPLAAARLWSGSVYNWNATCLCHRPLYFEEINLERHGYGCRECVQPLVSAAHFFGTVPALPYCMAVDCPRECIYTLGHYRPGSCPPWRHHWPPCDPVAAAAEGGVLTGMIFLIP